MATIYIKPAPINSLNFLRWSEPVAGPFSAQTFFDSGECLQIGNASTVQPEADYAIPMVYQDVISFTVNTPKDFGATNLLYLFFLQDNKFYAIPSFSTTYLTAGSSKYLTCDFAVPQLANGRYNLALTIQTGTPPPGSPVLWGKNVIAVSNPVRIDNYQSPQRPTVWADFRHSVTQFGYPYSTAPNVRNRFRLDALLTPAQPVENISTYEDGNRRTRFIGRGTLDRVAAFKTDYLDQPTHEAIAAMFLHDDLKINGTAYGKTETYETELDNDSYKLYQGQTRLKDLDFTQASNACTP